MASDPLNLDESGEWSGIWWLPGAPDEKVPGVLRYDSESGLSLSLIGAFEDRVISSLAPGVTTVYEGHRTWDVIHGAAERREITLLGCVPSKKAQRTYGARIPTPETQTIAAVAALIGAHVASENEAAFSRLRCPRRTLDTGGHHPSWRHL